MKKFLQLAFIIPIGTCSASAAQTVERFIGSGRACYGTLEIRSASIAWKTSFSTCESTYKVLDRQHQNGKSILVYELQVPTKQCQFKVISLAKSASGDSLTLEATGYGSGESYANDKRRKFTGSTPDMMSCSLVRE